jgi:hypothetical protein
MSELMSARRSQPDKIHGLASDVHLNSSVSERVGSAAKTTGQIEPIRQLGCPAATEPTPCDQNRPNEYVVFATSKSIS